jgi:hypothetical protein
MRFNAVLMHNVRLSREQDANMTQFCSAGVDHADIIAMLNEVERTRELMMGSREWRTVNPGKVYFESSPRAEPLGNAKRCYGLNNMVQQPRQVEGPPAALKTIDGEPDELQLAVSAYIRVRLYACLS